MLGRVFVTLYGGDKKYLKEILDLATSEIVVVLEPLDRDTCMVQALVRNQAVEFGPINTVFLLKEKHRHVELNAEDAVDYLRRERREHGNYLEIQTSSALSLASIASSLMSYRRLVDAVTAEQAIEMLTLLGDMMVLKSFGGGSPQIKNKDLNKQIRRSIIKTPEQMQIYTRGSDILNETESMTIATNEPVFDLMYQTRSGNFIPVKFAFGSVGDLGRRTAVLIGKNGIGKTQTLMQTAKKLLRIDTFNWAGLAKEFPDKTDFIASRVLCFYSGPRQSKAYPPQTRVRRLAGYKVFNLQDDGRPTSVSIVDVLSELLASADRIGDTTRFDIFRKSVATARSNLPVSVVHEELGTIDLMAVQLESYGDGLMIKFSHKYGDQHMPVSEFLLNLDSSLGVFTYHQGDFSSGEEAYIRFCAFAARYIENSSAILMDEPEVFLHPQFIDAMMGALHRMLQLTGSAAFLATHSAYVVRCAEEQLIYVMRSTSEFGVEFAKPRMKTFGADVGLLSLFVFGEDEMRTTTERARDYIFRQGGNGKRDAAKFLSEYTASDLISKIVNSNEEN